MITIKVELKDDDTLAYRPEIKGARWRGGFKDMAEVGHDADKAGLALPREIDFVVGEAP
jgi:hypothetical protein